MRQAIVPEFGFVADAESLRIGNEPPKPTWTSQAKTIRLSSDPQHRTLTTNEGPVHVEWGKRAEFAIVAEGERGQGWYLCQSCGRGIPRARTSRPPEKHKRPWDESPCHGTFRTLRMVHTFETDAVAITMPGGPPGNDDSALAGLMAGASDALEIPLDDIGGTTMRAGGRTRLVIYDTVPAGAGNAIRIGERLESIAAAAMQRVTNCTCGIDSSCYACLRHYRNQSVHEELARQDAIRRIEPLVDAVPLAPQPAPEPLPVPGAATYPAGWESVFELADPAERALLSALAERELPRPEVGVESGGGLPLSIAWPEHRIAVDGGFSAEDIQELQAEGWTLVAADVDAIMQALEGAARVDEV